jgi:serine/threonine-protein kinase
MDSLSSALYAEHVPAFGMRRQLIESLRAAARRSPDDAEVWNTLGEEGFHHGLDGSMSEAEVLDALDHAIALDSSFAPSYVHAITLAFATRGREQGLRYAHAFLARAHSGFQADGIRLALGLMDLRVAASDSVRNEVKRIAAQGLFEAWAAAQHAADDGEAAIVVARELASRSAVSAPRLASTNDRLSLLYDALLVRGHIREAAAMAHVVDPGGLALVARMGALPVAAVDRQFREWLEPSSALAVHGLEWWAFRRDTLAIAAFRQICARGATREAPCFGVFGEAAGTAYLALARGDSTTALDAFLALPDTLCQCILHRLTLVQLLRHAGRDVEAAARLRLPIGGLLYSTGLAAMLWELERAQNRERRGERAAAARAYQHVVDNWSRADPELTELLRAAEAGYRRVAGAP